MGVNSQKKETNMKKFLHKVLQIIVALLPMLVTLGIQIAVTIPVTFYYFSAKGLTGDLPTPDENLFQWIFDTITKSDYTIYVTVVWGIISMVVLVLWYRKIHNPAEDETVKANMNIYSIGGLILLVVGLQFAINYFYAIAEGYFPTAFKQYNDMLSFEDSTPIGFLIMAVYGMFIAPIHEEFLNRGVTLHYAQKAMPFWLANIFQALLFGFLHMNIVQGSYAFIVGIVLGYVYHEAKNIWIPILFHMGFNIFGLLVPLTTLDSTGTSAQVLIGLIGSAVAISGAVLFRTSIRLRES